MRCCRLILLIFMLLFTGCIIASIFLPIYRKDLNDTNQTRITIFFWHNDSVVVNGTPPEFFITRFYTRHLLCVKAKAFFLSMSAFSVMSAVFAVVACLVLACWTTAGYNICISVASLVLSIFAMLFSVVVLAAATVAFKHDFCVNETDTFVEAPQKSDYRLGEGFFLVCIAVGGFFAMFVTLVVCLCCECRSRRGPRGLNNSRKADNSNLPNSGPYLSATHSS